MKNYRIVLLLIFNFLTSCSSKNANLNTQAHVIQELEKENICLDVTTIDDIPYVVISLFNGEGKRHFDIDDYCKFSNYTAHDRRSGKAVAVIMNNRGMPTNGNKTNDEGLIIPSHVNLKIIYALPPFDFYSSELKADELCEKYIIKHKEFGELSSF